MFICSEPCKRNGKLQRWLTEYNSERPHESLNNLTPKEYLRMVENPYISKIA
ncbi:integrase core domain-containing protein [Serratia marcescens]